MSDSARRLQPTRKGNGASELGPTKALKCKWTVSYTLVSLFMHERRIGNGGRASSCPSHVRLGKARSLRRPGAQPSVACTKLYTLSYFWRYHRANAYMRIINTSPLLINNISVDTLHECKIRYQYEKLFRSTSSIAARLVSCIYDAFY